MVILEVNNGVTLDEGDAVVDLIRQRARGNRATLIITGDYASGDKVCNIFYEIATHIEEEADYESPLIVKLKLQKLQRVSTESENEQVLTGKGMNGFLGV